MAETLPPDPAALAARVRALSAGRDGVLLVALSGGTDSSALLHLMTQGALRGRVRALHCDHGLHPDSPRWADACQRLCTRLEVPLEVVTLSVAVRSPAGLEAAARAARYAALSARLGPDDLLLTAHHADDQAETFLLMALRGSGVAGLAAMPWVAALGRGRHARPLLDVPRAALAAHALRHALEVSEDPSNSDLARDRNRIRHATLPSLAPRWPSAARALGRAAAWCGEASELLEAYADAELASLIAAGTEHRLPIASLATLGPARLRNLLRRWLDRLELAPPPATALERVISEVLPARRDARARVTWPGAWVAKHRDHLHAGMPLQAFDASARAWDGLAPLGLPGGGVLVLEPTTGFDSGPGLALDRLRAGLEVRFRVGSESIRPMGSAHHRPLKKLLAEHGVLPWMRTRVPLLFVGGELAVVAGICVAADHASPAGSAGLRLVWRGHPPLH